MASITIRNLEDDVKTQLRRRAANHGRSIEEEARLILTDAVSREAAPERGLGTAIHEQFKPFAGVELDLPPRATTRLCDTVIFGFDSAWTDKTTGAICSLSFDARGRASFDPPQLTRFAEALKYIVSRSSSEQRGVVALDQPTIVTNGTGMRPVERAVATLLSFTGGGVQPANTSKAMFGPGAPVWRFKRNLGADDDPELARAAEQGMFLIEVFPALALPGLDATFAQRLCAPKYNPGNRKTFNPVDWRAVVEVTRDTAIELELADCVKWCSSLGDEPTKSDQDRLDSVLCALVAYIWLAGDRSASMLLGDLATGYMVTPVSVESGARLSKGAARKGVSWMWSGVPVSCLVGR